jgi:hypothetical protein
LSGARHCVLGAGFRLWLFGLPARHPCGGPFGSISRGAIYRIKSPIQRVHRAEFSPAWAAMQEITDWLRRLGLPEYAGAFAENGIDVSVLPHLTDQDLKDIGITARQKPPAQVTAWLEVRR